MPAQFIYTKCSANINSFWGRFQGEDMSVTVIGVWSNDHGHYKDEWFHESCRSIQAQTVAPDAWKILFFGRSIPEDIAQYGFESAHMPSLNYVTARRRSMDLVKTEWACVQDLDDTFEPGLIEAKLAYVEEHPDVVMVGSYFRFMDAEGELLDHQFDGKRLKARIERKPEVPPMAHPGVFIWMDAYRDCGGYDTTLKRAEDQDLWSRLIKHGNWGIVPEFLWSYRRHSGQTVNRPYKEGEE